MGVRICSLQQAQRTLRVHDTVGFNRRDARIKHKHALLSLSDHADNSRCGDMSM